MTNQQTDFNPTEWITTKEAAELTGYDDAHIRRLVGDGGHPRQNQAY